jgi:hypothetical protein
MVADRAPRGGADKRWLALLVALLFASLAAAQDAASLQTRHAALREQLDSNPYRRPLHIASQVGDGTLQGDVHARFGQPFALLGAALQDVGHWCDILILHPNVKGCRVRPGERLELNLGRKFEQPLDDTQPFAFRFRVLSARSDYLALALDADSGPLGTSEHRMRVELAALDAQRSFLHLSYAHAYGLRARLAMQGYLMTLGRDKLGFSVVGRDEHGQPIHVDGLRGVVERNVMRYYLAIEAYLDALAAPPAVQAERRLQLWHAGVSRYPRQLQEPALDDYLQMKRREIQRQQVPAR